jgi:hypothetical protein
MAEIELAPLLSQHSSIPKECKSTSPNALANYDILSHILHQITQFPLDNPPRFLPIASFYQDISVQRHQHNPTLLSCCLVSRAWYQPSQRALLHTIVLRTCERDIWFERVPLLAGGEGRKWVKKLVVVGGGGRDVMGLPTWPIWQLFPNLEDVEIFGLGWSTGGLLSEDGLTRAARSGWFKGVRRLDVTGCSVSENTLSNVSRRINSDDLPNILHSLPNLDTLILKGIRFQPQPPTTLDDTLPFQLKTLGLQLCIFNSESFCWLVGGSCDSLVTVEIKDTCLWNKKPQALKTVGTKTMADEEMEARNRQLEAKLDGILKRLEVEIPICKGDWK